MIVQEYAKEEYTYMYTRNLSQAVELDYVLKQVIKGRIKLLGSVRVGDMVTIKFIVLI